MHRLSLLKIPELATQASKGSEAMNLKKAIELNVESEKSLREHKFVDHANAILVGNEALKHFETYRRHGFLTEHRLLPGETDE